VNRREFLKWLGVTAVGLTVTPTKILPDPPIWGEGPASLNDRWAALHQEILRLHALELEKAFLFGRIK
jgi:hypothetical protein